MLSPSPAAEAEADEADDDEAQAVQKEKESAEGSSEQLFTAEWDLTRTILLQGVLRAW